jgi:UTP-glucose-1-phosphate uridylyltransferase
MALSHRATQGNLTEVTGLVEKPKVEAAPSNLIISGRYILQPEVMKVLETQDKGAGGEIQLTDAMAQMIGQQPFHAVTFEGKRYDCGSKVGLSRRRWPCRWRAKIWAPKCAKWRASCWANRFWPDRPDS